MSLFKIGQLDKVKTLSGIKIESHVLAVTIKWAELVDGSNEVVGRPGQYIGQSQI